MLVTELFEEHKVIPDSLINYQVGAFVKDYIEALLDDVEVSKIRVRTVGKLNCTLYIDSDRAVKVLPQAKLKPLLEKHNMQNVWQISTRKLDFATIGIDFFYIKPLEINLQKLKMGFVKAFGKAVNGKVVWFPNQTW